MTIQGSHTLSISQLGVHELSQDVTASFALVGTMDWYSETDVTGTPTVNNINEDLTLNIHIVVTGAQTTGAFTVTLDGEFSGTLGPTFPLLTNTGVFTSGTLVASAGWTVTLNDSAHTISGTLASVAAGTYLIQVKWHSIGTSAAPVSATFTSLSSTQVASGTKSNSTVATISALWSTDATSNWSFPANATEWGNFRTHKAALISVIGNNPDALHLMQDASGNPADAIGSFPLTAAGTGLTYANAVAGHSRKAINFLTGDTGVLSSSSASLPDMASDDITGIIIALVTTPAATRALMSVGTTLGKLTINSAGKMIVTSNANTATSANAETGSVRMFCLNQIASLETSGTTDLDTTQPITGTLAGKNITIGTAGGLLSPTMQVLYAAWWMTASHAFGSHTAATALAAAMKPL